MIVVGIAIFVLAIVVIGYLLVRGSRSTTISEQDFDDTYDGLAADGEVAPQDRDRTSHDFDDWQRKGEAERLSWEESPDE